MRRPLSNVGDQSPFFRLQSLTRQLTMNNEQ
jgi:hypothetical protein